MNNYFLKGEGVDYFSESLTSEGEEIKDQIDEIFKEMSESYQSASFQVIIKKYSVKND